MIVETLVEAGVHIDRIDQLAGTARLTYQNTGDATEARLATENEADTIGASKAELEMALEQAEL